MEISKLQAREVLDSRGYPTVEVELHAADPRHPGEVLAARAIVPSGASTGEGEAHELRDGDSTRFLGKGVLRAVGNVAAAIAPVVEGRSFDSQAEFDRFLLGLDGTQNKSALGANALLGASMAFARAGALAARLPLYESLARVYRSGEGTSDLPGAGARQPSGVTLPVPMLNIINGGKHADNGLAIQEFMVIPAGFSRFGDALRAGAEVFHHLKKLLVEKGLSTGVGDEGGFAPVFSGAHPHEQALGVILRAIEKAGYRPGEQVFLALDCAASEFVSKGGAPSSSEALYAFEGAKRPSSEMARLYEDWLRRYPIVSIEDGLAEGDWDGWAELTRSAGDRCQLVGDDLFVTNASYLKRGIERGVANAILIKVNQIGTITETLETMRLAAANGYAQVVSHRSGETEDTFIADLAVATDCGQIKTGSASRTDRVAKYNQLLRIEEALGGRARFLGSAALAGGRETAGGKAWR
jgi:enolase